MSLPQLFQERMQQQLGDEFTDFINALHATTPTSIRLNPRKKTTKFDAFEKVSWNSEGIYLPERPVFTLDPLFHAGAYYVQEASSMFIKTVLEEKVDFSRPLRVLDLCAAPGGKTTLLASMLTNDSILVANEVIKSRIAPLKENLQKWGFENYIVANHDSEELAELEGFFDIVLVDAPCSGEGLFRKDPNAANEWSENNVSLCSARQKRILQAASMLVAQEGYLIYSTCTYNDFENDENVKWIQSISNLQVEKLANLPDTGIVETPQGYQFYPHKIKGEGFYLAILKQTISEDNFIHSKVKLPKLSRRQTELVKEFISDNEALDFFTKADGNIIALRSSLIDDYGILFRTLEKRSSGLEIGLIKGNDFIPSHALALSSLVSAAIQRVELSTENALKYLKREEFECNIGELKGWFLVCYEGLVLGWAKVAGNRINNYLPKEWRIRMDIVEN